MGGVGHWGEDLGGGHQIAAYLSAGGKGPGRVTRFQAPPTPLQFALTCQGSPSPLIMYLILQFPSIFTFLLRHLVLHNERSGHG
jgi:hypothetical protein